MPLPQDIPIRANRLADGNYNIEDIRKLFKWARPILKPGNPVRDVGDFDAHPEQRTKGLTWEIGRSFCALLRMGALGQTAGLIATAKDLKVSLISCITFASQANDQKRSGFSNDELVSTIKNVADKIESFDGKQATFYNALTTKEQLVYSYIRSRRSVPLAFTAFSLTRSLFDLLVEHNVIAENRRLDFYKAECVINLFVVSILHLAVIDLKDLPGRAHLEAGTSSTHFDKMVVRLVYVIPEFERMLGTVRIYASDCDASKWVVPSLQSTVDGPIELLQDWDIPLEIGPNMKLQPLEGIEVQKGAIRPMPGVTIY